MTAKSVLKILQGSLKQQSLRRGAIKWFIFSVYTYKVISGWIWMLNCIFWCSSPASWKQKPVSSDVDNSNLFVTVLLTTQIFVALVLQSLVLGLLHFLHPLHTIPHHQLHQKVRWLAVHSVISCYCLRYAWEWSTDMIKLWYMTYPNCVNSVPSGVSSTGAIAGGVAAGTAFLIAVPAIGYALWRRRKPEEQFFDVPGRYYIPLCSCCHLCYSFHLYALISIQLRRILKFTLDNSRGSHWESFKSPQIILTIGMS